MSGHSKWAKIKRQKGVNDQKRGAIFTKLAKAISIAASEGGGDPDMNFALRLAVDKAKEANMPSSNIERAIKKGTGEGVDKKLQRVNYEGTLKEGVAFIVSCASDNTNRTVAELRKIFESGGGALGTSGSVAWQFQEVGIIEAEAAKLKESEKFGKESTYLPVDPDELILELMEIEGVIDIKQEGDSILITTNRNDFANVHKVIEEKKVKVRSAELQFVANEPLALDEAAQDKVLEFMEKLDDHDDVENVFTNANV